MCTGLVSRARRTIVVTTILSGGSALSVFEFISKGLKIPGIHDEEISTDACTSLTLYVQSSYKVSATWLEA